MSDLGVCKWFPRFMKKDIHLRGHKKTLQKGICLNDTKKKKIQFSPNRYLEWTEGRGDNGEECTSTKGKTGQI